MDDCIASFVDDLSSDDQVIVMNDGPDISLHWWERDYPDLEWINHRNQSPLGRYGHASRNYAMDIYVQHRWLWTLDDDDIAEEGAISAIRSAISSETAPWYVMKMRFGPGHRAAGHTIWHTPNIIVGNVGTPMIVAPVSDLQWGTSPDKVVGDGYFGDFEYAQRLQNELGEPGWREDVVAVIRP